MKYVVILPLLLIGCAFTSTPLPGAGNEDPKTFTSDGVVSVRTDGGFSRPPKDVDVGEAGRGADPADASEPELDSATGDPPDAMSPKMDAQAPPPDAATTPDADTPPDTGVPPADAEPPVDAAPPADTGPPDEPDYTDQRICQPCGSGCGPQSACVQGYCLPKIPAEKRCSEVCRGYLPLENGETCKSPDSVASCIVIQTTQACWI